jgi:hypothetical protein
MLELRYAGAWRAMSVLALLVILGATLVPSDWLWIDDPSFDFPVSDKWMHGITFTALSLWFSGQYARSSYWRIALGLLAFGILIEIAQRAVGYRSADLLDLAADLAGIVAGILIALTGAGGWTPKLEDWLQHQIG